MSFARPFVLAALVVPAILLFFAFRPRKQRKDVIRFADAALLHELKMYRSPVWRRRLPVFGILASLACMVVAAAEPQVLGPVEESSSTVILALDVSFSMRADDVVPNRFEAAKAAAIDFINAAPAEVQIGIVVFAARPDVMATPGTSRADLLQAVNNMQMSGGTAIGEAIYVALSLLDTDGWVEDPENPEESIQRRTGAVVLMSDGATNTGRPDGDAASAALAAGVPVYTVAFGTANGVIIDEGGVAVEVPVAPEPLGAVASLTNATTFEATTAEELSSIFESLAKKVAVVQAMRAVAHWFALLAAFLLTITAIFWVRFGARI